MVLEMKILSPSTQVILNRLTPLGRRKKSLIDFQVNLMKNIKFAILPACALGT